MEHPVTAIYDANILYPLCIILPSCGPLLDTIVGTFSGAKAMRLVENRRGAAGDQPPNSEFKPQENSGPTLGIIVSRA
jgi:hypothetical protein